MNTADGTFPTGRLPEKATFAEESLFGYAPSATRITKLDTTYEVLAATLAAERCPSATVDAGAFLECARKLVAPHEIHVPR